jgi:hypothetical protein
MIVFDLECVPHGHRFEGWFGSSDDFARQQARGLVTCPQCASAQVAKAPMAPRLTRKGNQVEAVKVPIAPQQAASPSPLPPEAAAKMHAAMQAIAAAQAEALKSSTWVGKNFAADARAMHYGDKEAAPIHGQASPDEAKALAEEGVEIAPILFPVAPPDEIH